MEHLDIHGMRVPVLGYGTWQLRGRDCLNGVRSALDIGYRHIDTAQMYENEVEVGRAIVESRVGRGDIFLTTKVWVDRLEPAPLRRSVEESLRKLQTDYVDLLLIHWPSKTVPLGPTLDAMQRLKAENRIRALGVSNFTVGLMREAVERHGAPIVNNQVEYHPFLSQRPVLDYVRRHGMFLTSYSPLARGAVLNEPVLVRIGEVYGKSASQVTLRWLIQQPGVAAIPKAGREAHSLANYEIFDFELTDDEMASINRLQGGRRTVSPDFAPDWDPA